MPENFFFFTGDNAFALREEKRSWKQRFIAKHGSENCLELQGKSVRYRELLDEVTVAPFIAEKRLCFVDGVPSFSKEEVEAVPQILHPDCILVIVDGHPDKRLAAVKTLLKIASVKEFPALKGEALLAWMGRYAQLLGARFSRSALQALHNSVGDDQNTLEQEMQKLIAYAPDREIEVVDVETLVVPSGEREVWQLTTELAEGRRDAALRYARHLLMRGEDPFSLWSILLWMLRNWVYVAVAAQEGQRQPAKIASQFGIPFPSVRTLLPLASRVPLDELKQMLEWAAEADVQVKTGGYRATRESPEEIVSLIERFILLCPSPQYTAVSH